MLSRLIPLMVLLGVLGLCTHAGAAPFTLQPDSSGRTLNGSIELLEDPSGQLTIADMADPAVQARFVPAEGRASVGQSRSQWWVKVQLARAPGAPAQWWLENSGITVYRVSLFLPDGQGGWRERVTSESVPFAEGRDHDYRRMVFRLDRKSVV